MRKLILMSIILTSMSSTFAQVFSIPNDAIVVRDTLNNGPGSLSYWLCPGSDLHMHEGSVVIFMEETSSCTYGTGTGSSTIYVKINSVLHYQSFGGDNMIYYESGAILDTTGPIGYNFFIESFDIEFDYWNAPKDGCWPDGIPETFPYSLSAYPNPTTGRITVNFPSGFLNIYNALGNLVYSSDHSCSVDLSGFGSGWYVLQLISDQPSLHRILVF